MLYYIHTILYIIKPIKYALIIKHINNIYQYDIY
jgi:hypothetical protein